jgi:hypothetical protein
MDRSLNARFTSNKSASCFGALFFSIIAFALPNKGMATPLESSGLKTEIGLSTLRFRYEEYNDSGGLFNKEQGSIPGITLKLGQRRSDWEWESAGSYHYGQVSYTGQTNLGSPYNTRTEESIGDVSLRLGRWFGERHPFMPFAGIGYRRWDRNILPGTLGGLFESYRWSYAWAGAKFMAYRNKTSSYVLDVGLLKPHKPELHIDFKGTYNVEPVVYPKSKLGLRVLLTSNWAFSNGTGLAIEPYYEFWELGRSPTVVDGPISVYEPASKTRNIGLNLRFAWTL